ncbi:MAG: polysaccharide deacetylase [Gammaproteobacteria bacterium SG8_11]|nr:MAG: polysaccharide deacetylase [Gammaproteobacteria bacterium SG8_11]
MIGEGKSVVLSFDDGPAPVGALTKILDTLAKNSIKSEFYVLGNEVKKYPNAAKMIVVQGHKIQNHSWGHPNLAKASLEKVQTELESTQAIIKEVTGITPNKVRPPYGAGGWPSKYDKELEKVANNLSLAIHNWDIDTEDWKSPRGIGPDKLAMIEKQFIRQAGKKFFDVLMHVQAETARDLPNLIAQLKLWGFSLA